MKREINLFKPLKQICRLRGIIPINDINTIHNPLIFISILMIPLLIPACFVNTAYGEVEDNRWSGMNEINSEYSSDDVPKDIRDLKTTTSTLVVTEAGPIADVDVKLNINHTCDEDLDVYLIAPDDTRIELFTDVGGSQHDFIDTIIDNEAGQTINEGSAPFTGSYRPEGNLSDLYGKEINGTWKLEVRDDSSGGIGVLNSWCLIVKIQFLEPVPSPVIICEPSLPDGICDIISWNDVGEICQHESSISETIPDEGTLTSTLVIDDKGMIEDLNVKVNISHDWDSELDVYLIAPDNTRVELFTDVGDSQDDFNDTVFDAEALLSINEGSAPFTGSYRPEGNLEDLNGKAIQGEWKLEITDNSSFGTGTLNSWSVIIDKADVLYYAECANDSDFSNVVANSGWMSERSCTFTDLDPDQEYWYRAKARPLQTWIHTSKKDFETDTFSDTKATFNNDVVLGSSDELGPEISVIVNPSFEVHPADEWAGVRSVHEIFIGRVRGLWASDGEWAGCNEFRYDGYYGRGDYAYQYQPVDWTGIETFIFDYASYFYGSRLRASVLIGDTEIWSTYITDDNLNAHYDIKIDGLTFSGYQDLKFQAESLVWGSFDAGIVWDNLRTYGPSDYMPFGYITSALVSLDEDDTWDILKFEATIPEGTDLTVDVLPETGSTPIAGYENVPAGTDLSDLGERTIRLRANLSTSDPEITPVLHDWSVTYTDASYESEWSNVESSLPQQ
jgi:subtilisin-like proprotein convertase family protein